MYRYCLQASPIKHTEAGSFPFSVNQFIAITDDRGGVSQALASLLKAARYHCEIVDEIPAHSDVVILLEGLRKSSSIDEALAINVTAFRHVQRIAKRFAQKGGLLITAQDTGGQFGLSTFKDQCAWSAGLTGLVKTAAIEWPKALCKAVDIDQANFTVQQIAERLFGDITQGRREVECGLLANGNTITMEVAPLPAQTSELGLDASDVLVVFGGGRGITAACLLELTKHVQPTFILLGRTPLEKQPAAYSNKTEKELREILFNEAKSQNLSRTPKQLNQLIAKIHANEEIANTLQSLRATGAKAEYFSVDILNQPLLTNTLNEIRSQYGSITGVIHGAGVLADKLLTDLTEEQFNLVFTTKVQGLQHLLHATSNDALRFIGLFSSVAGRFGNQGQAAYAMANEVLNKVAQAERRKRGNKCLVKAFNWGPWAMGMVTPELQALFNKRGIIPLSKTQGVKMFVDELMMINQNEVEIICGERLDRDQKNQIIWEVTAAKHPFLTSHMINNEVVLPACLVLDQFMRLGNKPLTQHTPATGGNFQVLNGIRLPDFAIQTQRFNIESNSQQITLATEQKRLCYSFDLTKEVDYNTTIQTLTTQTIKYEPWPWQKNVLFHGPKFQVIHHLDGISHEGGIARLGGLLELNWPKDEWAIDVAALDGVLQLLLLWRHHWQQDKTLPTKIGSISLFSSTLPQSELTCIFRCHTQQRYRFLADAILLQNQTDIYAVLQNIEMCVAKIG